MKYEILTFAMGIVYGENNYDEISRIYMEITGGKSVLRREEYERYRKNIKETSRLSVVLELPPVKLINVSDVKEIYESAAQLLISA